VIGMSLAAWSETTGWIGPAMVALAVTIVVFAALWRLSLRLVDCSVVDLYWGFGFGVIAWVLIGLSGNTTPAALLLAGLVSLWSARLGIHLWHRHRRATEEDPRYADMRRRHGEGWPKLSFWLVFMLQAIVMWLIALPLHLALGVTGPDVDLTSPAISIGLIAFALGFSIEALADAALVRFKAVQANHGRLLTTGLFAWSRHPNYFGEALLWWGFGLIAYGICGQLAVFTGPVLLTLLLLKVSGIPPLEAHLSGRPGFADYVAATSPFVPLPPKTRRPATQPAREDGQA
jgi:steroid 5-alpha reductase family enzyme